MRNRSKQFLDLYKSIPKDAPDHERILSGSARTSILRHRQLWVILQSDKDARNQLKALDFGSGLGRFTEFIAEQGYSVLGVDYCDDFVVESRKRAADKNLNIVYEQGSYQELDKHQNSAQILVCVGVMQNLDECQKALAAMYGTLMLNGQLGIEVLNRFSLNGLLATDSHTRRFGVLELKQLWRGLKTQNSCTIYPVIITPGALEFLQKPLEALARIPLLKWLTFPFAHGLILAGKRLN